MTFKRTLVFILISINITIAQNINLLDEKNGFKSFKLGEKFDVYKNDLKFIDFNENSDAIYEYTGLDKNLKTLFDLELEDVTLIFNSEKKLIHIRLIPLRKPGLLYYRDKLEKIEELYADLSKVLFNFKSLFGEAIYKENNENGKRTWSWYSKNTFLVVSPEPTKENMILRIYIGLNSPSSEKVLKDGF